MCVSQLIREWTTIQKWERKKTWSKKKCIILQSLTIATYVTWPKWLVLTTKTDCKVQWKIGKHIQRMNRILYNAGKPVWIIYYYEQYFYNFWLCGKRIVVKQTNWN